MTLKSNYITKVFPILSINEFLKFFIYLFIYFY